MGIKSTDVPHELRELNKQFMLFTRDGYAYDVAQVFADLLTYGLEAFKVKTSPALQELHNRYKPEGYQKLHELFYHLMKTYGANVPADKPGGFGWWDGVGMYYEVLASGFKRSAMGQFFTPPTVCDFMAAINVGDHDLEDGQVITVNDCACGSGRTLLAAYTHLQGRCILYAEDLDPICAKMAAFNFLLHGCRGEVVCHNSLAPDTFHFGYHVRPYEQMKMPHLADITAEQSHIVSRARETVRRFNEKKQPESVTKPAKRETKQPLTVTVVQQEQLKLF